MGSRMGFVALWLDRVVFGHRGLARESRFGHSMGSVLFKAASRFRPLSLIAAALISSFLFAKTVVSSESPTYSKVIGYGLGYWLWLGSALVLLIGATRAFLSRHNTNGGHGAP